MLFLLRMISSTAQLLTVNGATLTINSGATITVNGDVEMKNAAAVNNSGTISLTGNWINNVGAGIFGTSKGTMILNGGSQHIQGGFPTTFYHLTFQNGIKTLHTDITTGGGGAPYNGVLNLNNAVLSLKSNMVSVLNSSATAIQRTTGYILSEESTNLARVWWVNVNAGTHTIPFGNNAGDDISFAFTISPPSGFQVGSLRVATYSTLPDNTPYPVSPVVVNHVNNTGGSDNSANTVDRFWHIEQNGICSFTFKYAPGETPANGNTQMRAQEWNTLNAGWMMPLAGQSNPTSQQVFVPSAAPISPGTLVGSTWALAMSATPLPVELLAFDATATGPQQVKCTWTTASEINNDFFTIQRSQDGVTFTDIGKKDGNGTTHELHHYELYDDNALQGTSYYRMQQTDYDGTITLSPVIAVHLSGKNAALQLFPVPADQSVFVRQHSGDNIHYAIYDASGKLVLTGEETGAQKGFFIATGQLQNGLYHLEMVSGNRKESTTLPIVHQ
mgnify:CR=1 FL=1